MPKIWEVIYNMANIVTKFLNSRSKTEFTNAHLLNNIRKHASDSYKADIPNISGAINHDNVPYQQFEIHQNEFFKGLIDRIGSTVIKALQYENALGIFKSELFEFGDTLQEIYVAPAERETYNGKDPISPFKFADTDIEVFYHTLNNENLYERTFERAWVQKAFTSEYAFDEFINKMFTSLLSSDQIDEYAAIKKVLEKSLTEINYTDKNGTSKKISVPMTKVDTNVSDFIIQFNQDLINKSKQFTIPSRTRFNNPVGVPNATPIDDQYLIISYEYSTHLDMLLANAFNMDKASVLARTIVVDDFEKFTGTGVNEGRKPVAFLVSKNSIILKDKLVHMESIRNPRSLSFNYFYHHHYMTSLSMFENIHGWYIEE